MADDHIIRKESSEAVPIPPGYQQRLQTASQEREPQNMAEFLEQKIGAPDFKIQINHWRKRIKDLGEIVNSLHEASEFRNVYPGVDDPRNFNEMHANITLTYRHLEDAAMRLGKVIQAWDGGKSVYDK